MEHFKKLPWKIKEPAMLNDIQEFLSDECISELRALSAPMEYLLQKVKLKTSSSAKNALLNNKIRGYRTLPKYPETKLSVQDHRVIIEYMKHALKRTRKFTNTTRTLLTTVQQLESIIQEERLTYNNFAKNNWLNNGMQRCLTIQPEIEQLFEEYWKRRILNLNKYPNYYKEYKLIPLVSAERIACDMQEEAVVYQMGGAFRVRENYPTKRIFLKDIKTEPSWNKKTVSSDSLAISLAQEHLVDVVVSPSGLKHLINNYSPYKGTWRLPVKIIEHNCSVAEKSMKKRIIFIDKALPLNHMTNMQKNYKIYKKIVKTFLARGSGSHQCGKPITFDIYDKPQTICHCNNTESKLNKLKKDRSVMNNENPSYKNITSGNSSDESFDNLIIDEENGNEFSNHQSEINLKKEQSINIDKKDNISSSNEKLVSHCNCKQQDVRTRQRLSKINNVVYKIFNLSPSADDTTSRQKQKMIRILLRHKIDAFKTSNGIIPAVVVPKLEYQLEFGAEVCNKEELCSQWISTCLQPQTIVLRVRVDPENSEYIATTECNKVQIQSECTYLYDFKPVEHWSCVYNILAELLNCNPGEYMLSHLPKNGPFVNLMFASDPNGADLDMTSLKAFHPRSDCNVPWLPIDNSVILPLHEKLLIAPGLFQPATESPLKKKTTKQNLKKTNMKRKRTNKKTGNSAKKLNISK